MKKPLLEKYKSIYCNSSLPIKISLILTYFIMGLGQMFQKQFVRGIMFLLIEAAYLLYMISSGFESLMGFFTLNVHNVQSNFSLLYGILAIIITAFFVFCYLLNLKLTYNNASKIIKGEPLKSFKDDLKSLANEKFYATALAIPIVGALLFTVLPLVFMICIAFTDYGTSGTIPIMNVKNLSWTGFESFKSLFSNSQNFKALKNVFGWTIIWAFLATFTCYFGGFLLALLINKKSIKIKPLFRSVFVVTMAIPQFLSLRVMNTMFSKYGPINTILLDWGLITERIAFWDDPLIAKTLIILINMWVGIPYFMLLISGLLINIPKDYYEAAEIDGASKTHIFFKITLPHIVFMTTPLLITNFISNINNFNVIWFLTNGGPTGLGTGGSAGGTDILITWLYKLTMQHNPEYNIGAAIGIIMFIISASLSLIIYRRSAAYNREEEYQ